MSVLKVRAKENISNGFLSKLENDTRITKHVLLILAGFLSVLRNEEYFCLVVSHASLNCVWKQEASLLNADVCTTGNEGIVCTGVISVYSKVNTFPPTSMK